MLLAGTQTGFQPVLRVCRAAIATVTVPTNLCIKENKLCAVIDYGSASKVLKKDPRNWPESGAKEREERREGGTFPAESHFHELFLAYFPAANGHAHF